MEKEEKSFRLWHVHKTYRNNVKGLTQKKAAKKLNYDQALLSKHEDDKHDLPEDIYGGLLDLYDITDHEKAAFIVLQESKRTEAKRKNELGVYNFRAPFLSSSEWKAKDENQERNKDKEKNIRNETIKDIQLNPYPAFIVDSCWFVYGYNEPYLRLHNLTPENLNQPEYWHGIYPLYLDDTPMSLSRVATQSAMFKIPQQRFFRSAVQYLHTRQGEILEKLLVEIGLFRKYWKVLIQDCFELEVHRSEHQVRYLHPKYGEITLQLSLNIKETFEVKTLDGKMELRVVTIEPTANDAQSIEVLNSIARGGGTRLYFAYQFGFETYDDWFESISKN